HEVEENERGRRPTDLRQRLLTVPGRGDVVPLAPQHQRHLVARVGVVLDDEDTVARSITTHGTSARLASTRGAWRAILPKLEIRQRKKLRGIRPIAEVRLVLSGEAACPIGQATRSTGGRAREGEETAILSRPVGVWLFACASSTTTARRRPSGKT